MVVLDKMHPQITFQPSPFCCFLKLPSNVSQLILNGDCFVAQGRVQVMQMGTRGRALVRRTLLMGMAG